MVDLAALARQMKAIGRKGSGKDYYEQYVAQGIANGERRAARGKIAALGGLKSFCERFGLAFSGQSGDGQITDPAAAAKRRRTVPGTPMTLPPGTVAMVPGALFDPETSRPSWSPRKPLAGSPGRIP